MSKIYNHTVSIKLSDAGIQAWNGLIKFNVPAGPILRDRGESEMIKYYETFLNRRQREKLYGKNYPSFMFDN
jgi:hypothetical protein